VRSRNGVQNIAAVTWDLRVKNLSTRLFVKATQVSGKVPWPTGVHQEDFKKVAIPHGRKGAKRKNFHAFLALQLLGIRKQRVRRTQKGGTQKTGEESSGAQCSPTSGEGK